MRYILTAILASVSMSQLLGCAAIQTYPGERLPRDKVAVIRVEGRCDPMTMNIIEIVAIDEKKVESEIDRTPGFAILPGRHKISVLMSGYEGFFVTHRVTGCSERIDLTLNAIAGETYALRAFVSERLTVREFSSDDATVVVDTVIDSDMGETNERHCLLFFVPYSFSPGDTLSSTVFVNDCKL